jgi:DNA-binding Xre family transcriptional regulator
MEGLNVSFSYKPLWKLLIDKDMSKKSFMELTGVSKSTVDKMNRGEYVSMEVINRICCNLHCDISEVVAFVEEKNVI